MFETTLQQQLQERRDLLPPLLKNDERYWFLKHTWFKCEPPINSHFAGIVCNESGKGKSYLTMGIVAPGYPDFDPNESIAFSAEDFTKIAAEKHPRHFPLILDDAGLSAFSGDALTLKVKRMSKIAQSIRHKHWQIMFNLPSFELMAKSVKITNHYYLEPVWIDYEKQITHAKFQRLKIHPFTGALKRMNMVRKIKIPNPITGYVDLQRQKILTVPVPKVSDKIARQYENLQSEFKQRFAEEYRGDLGWSLVEVDFETGFEETHPYISFYYKRIIELIGLNFYEKHLSRVFPIFRVCFKLTK